MVSVAMQITMHNVIPVAIDGNAVIGWTWWAWIGSDKAYFSSSHYRLQYTPHQVCGLGPSLRGITTEVNSRSRVRLALRIVAIGMFYVSSRYKGFSGRGLCIYEKNMSAFWFTEVLRVPHPGLNYFMPEN